MFEPATPRSNDPPEQEFPERRIALLLFLLTCGYLFLFRRYTTVDPDEGIILQGAQRILQGEVLYRDFFSFLTPGSYYLLAFLFKIFGSSLLAGRAVLVFVGGVSSVVTYLLARRVCARWSALLAAALVTLTCLPYRFLVLHNWDGTLWACLALYCAVRWVESSSFAWAVGAGSFTSLTFLFEQSKGAGLALGLGLGLLIAALLDRQGTFWKRVPLAGLAVGILWPVLVVLAYFGLNHSLAPMLADWLWPLRHYSLVNLVPYGYQGWSDSTRQSLFGSGSWGVRFLTVLALCPCFLVPVLPIVALALAIYWTSRMWRRQAAPAKCAYYILVSTTLGGLLLSVVIVRADISHFMYLEPLFALVLAWIIDGRDIPGRVFDHVRPLLIAFVTISFLLMAMALLLRSVAAPFRVETRRGAVTLPARDTVIEYVQAHVAPGEKMLVYPYLPTYYYLTATYSPSRFEFLMPGFHTPRQFQELLSELAVNRTRVVLFESSFTDKIPASWPAAPLKAIANDPVADYILQNYRACRVLKSPRNWRFLFMVRKELACP